MGATNPKDAEKNTIRQLYGISIDKNSVHMDLTLWIMLKKR